MLPFKNLFYKPFSAQLTITSNNGFHLRPVAQFSSLAKSFACQITATFNGKTVDTKSVNTLLSLSLEKGDTFTLSTQGKHAQNALSELLSLFEDLMKDEKEVHTIEKSSYDYAGDTIEGEIISEGIAIAPTYRYHTTQIQHESTMNFKDALHASTEELEALYSKHKEDANAAIYLAQKELLSALGNVCHTLFELETKVKEESQKLLGTKLEAKKSDYEDILQRVKKHLGLEIKTTFPETPFILLCIDLLPSQIDQLQKTSIAGVIIKESSIHSHAAILLRSAGIPSLIADTESIIENKTAILDAHAGVIVQSPTSDDLQKGALQLERDEKEKSFGAQRRFEFANTKNGKLIKVLANVSDVNSAIMAREEGAEGIGLLRSEFLFKDKKPTFEAQHDAYKKIFELFDEITVRTLDVGGDKMLPYIQLPQEQNPFLGIRGVRLFDTHSDLLEEQLYAIFQAAQDRSIKIMFPMVSTLEEFTKAKSFAQNIALKYQIDISHHLFGIMIEVPSVLFMLESFNEAVDFYSIGTNDLTQYLFAIERTHPTLKTDELSPAVFSAIETICKKASKPVSICGELASNKEAIAKLLDLGIETLSVSPKRIAQTKEIIRHA